MTHLELNTKKIYLPSSKVWSMSWTILLSKKQQVLGNGIPSRADLEENKDKKADLKLGKSHSKQQLDLFCKPSRIQHLSHRSEKLHSKHTISLGFSDSLLYAEQDTFIQYLDLNEFNNDLILSNDFHLILPIFFTGVKRNSSKKDGTVLRVEYTFNSDEEIQNVRLCRDEIARLKHSSSIKEKLMFMHDLCWTAWYILIYTIK